MAISSLLNQNVNISVPSANRSKDGKPILQAGSSYPARFERTNRTIVNKQGEQEPIHGIVFLRPDASVAIGAKLTFGSDDYRVMAKSDEIGRDGNVHHVELMVQLWSFSA